MLNNEDKIVYLIDKLSPFVSIDIELLMTLNDKQIENLNALDINRLVKKDQVSFCLLNKTLLNSDDYLNSIYEICEIENNNLGWALASLNDNNNSINSVYFNHDKIIIKLFMSRSDLKEEDKLKILEYLVTIATNEDSLNGQLHLFDMMLLATTSDIGVATIIYQSAINPKSIANPEEHYQMILNKIK